MCQYTGQAYPGVNFLFIQFVINIVQGKDTEMLLTDGYVGDTDGEVDCAAFVGQAGLQLISGAAMGEKSHKICINTVKLADMGEDFQA